MTPNTDAPAKRRASHRHQRSDIHVQILQGDDHTKEIPNNIIVAPVTFDVTIFRK